MQNFPDLIVDSNYRLKTHANGGLPAHRDMKADTCKFCGLSSEQTTFSNRSHIIPEFLGKNSIYDLNECDQCNTLFSAYENSLVNLFQPFLTMTNVKGKRGVPMFQPLSGTSGRRSRMKIVNDAPTVWLGENKGEYEFDDDKGEGKFKFKCSYIPLFAYKAMVKIGLNLMPENKLKAFPWIKDRLCNKSKNCMEGFTKVWFTSLGSKGFLAPEAALYESIRPFDQNKLFPEYSVVLCSSNVIIQAFLPPTEMRWKEMSSYERVQLTSPYIEYQSGFTPSEWIDLYSSQKTILNKEVSFTYSSRDSSNVP